MSYTIHCDYDDDDGFSAYIDEMPGAISQGDTLEATLVNLADAVQQLHLATLDAGAEKLNPVEMLQQLARDTGGTINEVGVLPDGSGFATMSLPLPKDHWLTAEEFAVPPMPFRMGAEDRIKFEIGAFNSQGDERTWRRKDFEQAIRAAGRYAARAATMNGKEIDFDPDALVQNFVVGMLGYFTETGLGSEAMFNPPPYEATE